MKGYCVEVHWWDGVFHVDKQRCEDLSAKLGEPAALLSLVSFCSQRVVTVIVDVNDFIEDVSIKTHSLRWPAKRFT